MLPEELTVNAEGAYIGLTHNPGLKEGREERLRLRFPECAVVVYGHTHLPQAERHGGVWILNPGSPTERRRAPERTMIELTIKRGQPTHAILIALP